MTELDPNFLLNLYANGYFPMAESRSSDEVFIFDPEERGIIPLESFHIPRKLKKVLRQDSFQVTVNKSFDSVMRACAAPGDGREETWINDPILVAYNALHHGGFAHSVEVWNDDKLVGGLYGVSLGQAFFGESMFSRETDASKIALCHLVGRLIAGNYKLLDTQYVTPHLEQFGCIAVARDDYKALLKAALEDNADFHCWSDTSTADQVLQAITQTS